MDRFEEFKLDATGAPELEPEEVVLMMQADVDLYDGDAKRARGGIAYITSFRLMYLDASRSKPPTGTRLAHVTGVETVAGFLLASPKVVVHLADRFVKLSFKGGGRDEFHAFVATALQRKSWEAIARAKQAARTSFSTSHAGVAGLQRMQQQQQARTQQLTAEAFSDLSSLMEKAQAVVVLCQRYAEALEHERAAAAAAGDASPGGDAAATARLSSLLRDVGISSPVTRQSAGALYHQELARQLVSFLRQPLAAGAGMLTLTDVYCLYNRARGTDLVSPDDVLQACQQAEALGLPLRLKRFASGVLVVQSDIPTAMQRLACDHLARAPVLVRDRGWTTALLLSKALGVSVPVATQYLQQTEQAGSVCRDESVEGLRFYPNRFVEAA